MSSTATRKPNPLIPMAFLAIALPLLAFSMLMFTFDTLRSQVALDKAQATRASFWSAITKHAAPDQRGTLLFIRSRVESRLCVGSRALELRSDINYEQALAALVDREKECLDILREEVAISKEQSKVEAIIRMREGLH